MTTIETQDLSPYSEHIVHNSAEPLPRVVANHDLTFVVNSGEGELAVGDDAVIKFSPGKRTDVNQGTQYQVLWGNELDLTIEYR